MGWAGNEKCISIRISARGCDITAQAGLTVAQCDVVLEHCVPLLELNLHDWAVRWWAEERMSVSFVSLQRRFILLAIASGVRLPD